MLRVGLVTCVLIGAACSDQPYVIGRGALDAGPPAGDAAAAPGGDECASEAAGALFCSGFESPALLDEWDATSTMEGGELERSSALTHAGGGALRAASDAAMSIATVTRGFAPVLTGDLHLRLHVYVASGQPTRIMNILYVGDVAQPAPFIGIDFNLNDGALEVFSPQGDPARQTAETLVPRDRWFCLRARIAVSDTGLVQLYVDDALVLEATGIDTLPDAGLRELRAGIDWSSDQDDPFEIYLDDLVLDLSPVACR